MFIKNCSNPGCGSCDVIQDGKERTSRRQFLKHNAPMKYIEISLILIHCAVVQSKGKIYRPDKSAQWPNKTPHTAAKDKTMRITKRWKHFTVSGIKY